jgi:hypothetical protein
VRMKGILIILLVSVLSLMRCSDLCGQDSERGRVFNTDEIKRAILYKGSYALLIGNSKYRHWADLNSIPEEMKNLGALLEKQHHFVVEPHENLTNEQLKKTVDQFINDYGFEENNRLLIYFSGHGHTRERRNSQIGYIVPTDAPALNGKEIEFAKNAVDMEQIVGWAKRIEAKHALFVFDSCFASTVFDVKSPLPPPYITASTMKHVRQFITAGEKEVPARSVFINFLIEGIKGEADRNKDGYITGSELGGYVREKVMAYSEIQEPGCGKIKDPELDRGDFVFILEPPGPKSGDFTISAGGVPSTVASSHVTPDVSIVTGTMYENLYLLPITEDEGNFRTSMGKRIVFKLNENNQYEFEWKDGIVYAGGEVVSSGREFKIHFIIVSDDVYKRVQSISSMNKEQFDEVDKIAVKKVSFWRDQTK